MSCSQMVRSLRWYEAHRPEDQRRPREAYAKEVKAKYLRVQITTIRPAASAMVRVIRRSAVGSVPLIINNTGIIKWSLLRLRRHYGN